MDVLVQFSNETEACHEANRSGQQEKHEYNDERVAEIQERWRRIIDGHFRVEEIAAINEDVERRAARREERSPPPVIVFHAQMKETQKQRWQRARDDH